MRHASLRQFIAKGAGAIGKGPVALVFVEDLVEVESTIHHHLGIGFRNLILFAPVELDLPAALAGRIVRVDYEVPRPGALEAAVNAVIAAVPGVWLYYCFNAEYLFYPFAAHRTVGEMLAFHTEERRDAILSYVVDLYAGDLGAFPNAVSLEHAYLDRSGYYAVSRPDPADHAHPKERQLDFHGGLRWRFEEHVPWQQRRIDRIALFRAKPGLTLRGDHTFNDEEYNTFSCPWHHNITTAIASFRTAKALKSNPGSASAIGSFLWRNSIRFNWEPQQLLDLGLMEPGQWF